MTMMTVSVWQVMLGYGKFLDIGSVAVKQDLALNELITHTHQLHNIVQLLYIYFFFFLGGVRSTPKHNRQVVLTIIFR